MTEAAASRGAIGGYLPHLGVMLAMQSLTSVSAASVPVLAPVIAPHAGVAAADVGLFTMVLYACGMASALIGGILVPRHGALRVCQVALLFCATALALAATGHAIGLLACAFVLGSGMGAPTPASSHVLVRVTPTRLLNLVFSIKQTGVPLGGAIAGATLPALTLLLGWRGALLGTALLCCVGVGLLQLWRMRTDDDRELRRRGAGARGVLATIGLIWRDAELRLVAIASAIFSAGQVCISAFYVTYLVEAVGLNLTVAGLALAAAQIGGVAGRIVWGAVADWSRRPLLVLAGLAVIATVGMVLASRLAPGGPVLAIHALSFVLGASTIGWAGVVYAEVGRRAPPGRTAEASGGVTAVMFAGIVIGPAIFGLIVRATQSFTIAFTAMASCLALVVVVLLVRLARGGAR
ncbi:MFS transporter [Reyranella sp.]|uniref:MFS transporter n=1 Tax=Reyranella sp. TaxID=1929291 RepID=UPI003784EC72